MYICQICHKKFNTKEELVKHFLHCWKEKNPSHESKEAPRSEAIERRKVNDDMMNFFNLINEEENKK